MKTMKQFGFAALVLVIGVTLCANAAAQSPYPLSPTGAEPGAAGQYTLAEFKFLFQGTSGYPNYIPFQLWRGSVTVTCQGLTPGATYSTSAGQFNADGNGNGSVNNAQFPVQYQWCPFPPRRGWVAARPVTVYRVNPDGSQTLVLRGAPYWPYPPR